MDGLTKNSLFMFKALANPGLFDLHQQEPTDVHNAPSIIQDVVGRRRGPAPKPRSSTPRAPLRDRGGDTGRHTSGSRSDGDAKGAVERSDNDSGPISRRLAQLAADKAARPSAATSPAPPKPPLVRATSGRGHEKSMFDRALQSSRDRSRDMSRQGYIKADHVKTGVASTAASTAAAPTSAFDDKLDESRRRSRRRSRHRGRDRSRHQDRSSQRDHRRYEAPEPSRYYGSATTSRAEQNEKRDYLIGLEKLKQQGITLTKQYTMNDPLVDIQYEFERHNTNMEGLRKVETSKSYIRISAVVIITANHFLGRKLALDGWLERLNAELESPKYFLPLEEMYRSMHRRGPPSPWLSLAIMFASSLVFTHCDNKYNITGHGNYPSASGLGTSPPPKPTAGAGGGGGIGGLMSSLGGLGGVMGMMGNLGNIFGAGTPGTPGATNGPGPVTLNPTSAPPPPPPTAPAAHAPPAHTQPPAYPTKPHIPTPSGPPAAVGPTQAPPSGFRRPVAPPPPLA